MRTDRHDEAKRGFFAIVLRTRVMITMMTTTMMIMIIIICNMHMQVTCCDYRVAGLLPSTNMADKFILHAT